MGRGRRGRKYGEDIVAETEKRKRVGQMATWATPVRIWWEHAHPGGGKMQRGLKHESGLLLWEEELHLGLCCL